MNINKRKQNKRAIFIIVYGLFLLIVLEVFCRLVFPLGREKSPFFEPRKVIYLFYPELKIVDQKKGDTFDILLLGSSVLNKDVSDIENLLCQALFRERGVKIYNLSTPAHSSLDHYYKYKFLQDRKFDLVVLYEGINEARANNCPERYFREDYSNYSWYRYVNVYERHEEIRYILFPYVLDSSFMKLLECFVPLNLIPTHGVKEEWLDYGKDIKTTVSYRKNVEKILKIAQKKHEKILLMTFAYYIPENYTFERCRNKSLDYGTQMCPIENWGKPENVESAIVAHNEIIKDLAKQYSDNVIFIDQLSNIPGGKEYFDDICHLTHEGSRKFVDNIKDVILEQISD